MFRILAEILFEFCWSDPFPIVNFLRIWLWNAVVFPEEHVIKLVFRYPALWVVRFVYEAEDLLQLCIKSKLLFQFSMGSFLQLFAFSGVTATSIAPKVLKMVFCI